MRTTKRTGEKLGIPYHVRRVEIDYDLVCPFCGSFVEFAPYADEWECECSLWQHEPDTRNWERQPKREERTNQ